MLCKAELTRFERGFEREESYAFIAAAMAVLLYNAGSYGGLIASVILGITVISAAGYGREKRLYARYPETMWHYYGVHNRKRSVHRISV